MIKQAAEKAASAPAESSEPENPDQPRRRHRSRDQSNPLVMFAEQIQPFCDLRNLPDFDKVRKYFGSSGATIQDHELGLFAEALYLPAPEK